MKDLPSNLVLIIIDVQKAIDHPSWGRRNNSQVHALSLANLHGEYATVTDTETVLRQLLP